MPNLDDMNPLDENAILKEVWNIVDVDAKTELSDLQISSVNKLKSMSLLFGNEFLSNNLNSFMVLQKSRNRKSLSEFVDIVKKFKSDDIKFGGMGGLV